MKPEEVMAYILHWEEEKRTGNIQINFFKGGISNINLNQCVKEPDLQKKIEFTGELVDARRPGIRIR